MTKKPVLLMAFAANDLPEVYQEAEKTWEYVQKHQGIQAILLKDVETIGLINAIITHHENICFFHFGGHATNQGLTLNGSDYIDKVRLSRLLLPENKNKQNNHDLQWAFLNGCESYGHVGILIAKGAKAVIATNNQVSSNDATALAILFYKSFFEKKLTLKNSFHNADAVIQHGAPGQIIVTGRGEINDEAPITSGWTLFLHPDHKEILNWTIDNFITSTVEAQDYPALHNTSELTLPPLRPDFFLGRDSELEIVYQKLFHKYQFLLLVTGKGGIGKTTLAAKYWEEYKSYYSHVAWIFAGDDLSQALLTSLSPKLSLAFPAEMPVNERFPLLLQKFNDLEKPCLLIIDNVTAKDLEKHYLDLRRFSEFHLILTSRIAEFEQISVHTLQPLESESACQLFQRYYPKYQASEHTLLLQILEAVDYNTLIIQLLAKSLHNLNRFDEEYSLAQLHLDLQDKGVLGTNQEEDVTTDYHSKDGALTKATPEAIIEAMYDLGELEEKEKRLLSVFAVLPAERIDMILLKKLLPNTNLRQSLNSLFLKGWLDFEQQEPSRFFKISPVIQHIIRKKQKTRLENIQDLIKSLLVQLKRDGYNHFKDYKEAEILSRYTGSLLSLINEKDRDIANLYERVGKYYEITGNLQLAFSYFQKYHDLYSELKEINNDPDCINGLAIACERLGDAYLAINSLDLALENHTQYNTLEKYLNDLYPDNLLYQKNLATSYSKLGDVWKSMAGAPQGKEGNILGEGAIFEALKYYDQDLKITQLLHSQDPNNQVYQNNLAISFSKKGDAEQELGFKNGLEYFENAHQIFESLKSSYPENIDYQNGLAMSYEKLGGVYKFLENLSDALKNYEQSHAIIWNLANRYPSNLIYQHNLAKSFANLGKIHHACGDFNKALYSFEQELELFNSLKSTYPDSDYRSFLTDSYSSLEQIHKILGNLTQSQGYFERSQQLNDDLQANSQSKIAYQNGLGISYSRLGELE